MDFNSIFEEYYTLPKRIPGYSNYSITPSGQIFSHNLRKIEMKQQADKAGYLRTSLIGDNLKRKGVYIHRAVATTYLPNPKNKPHVNHLDNNPSNNCVDNLEWCTPGENMAHSAKQGRRPRMMGEENGHAKWTLGYVNAVRNRFKEGYTQMEISKMYNMPFSTVHVIVRRKQWSKA